MVNHRTILLAASALVLAACETTATSDGGGSDGTAASESNYKPRAANYGFAEVLAEAGAFGRFEPTPTGRSSAIDYEVVSDALDAAVFNTGPSLRTVARPKRANVGTRFVRGHDSPLRLEGNKIFFSQFDKETKASFNEYTESLIDIGNRVDITTLRRNEQLAYWLNLHNMVVINEIMKEYPVRVPIRMKIGPNNEPFHDAKIISIRGVDMSLRDIRQNIVYRYWDDPIVMYGFFHGDLGSPNIVDTAYTGENVVETLERNGREFVNSLRGVARGGDGVFLSKHYFEARAGLFPNWPDDIRAHLDEYARDEVKLILATKSELLGAQYEDRTADLVGGDPRLDILVGPTSVGVPPQLSEFVLETRDKLLELRRSGRLRSRVIIIDDPDAEEEEDPRRELE